MFRSACLAAGVLSLFAASAFAQQAGNGNGQNGARGNGRFNNNNPNIAAAISNAILQPYTDEFTDMSSQLTLTDDEKTKVKADIDAMNTELQDFVQNARQEILQSMRGNRQNGAAQANMQAARDLLAKDLDDFQTLADTHEIKIDADLDPEQRETWEIFRLNRMFQQRLDGLALDDDQKAKVKDAVDAAGKEIAAATDAKDVPPIRGKLAKKLVSDILTDDQAIKLFSAPTINNNRFGGGPGPANINPGGPNRPAGRRGNNNNPASTLP